MYNCCIFLLQKCYKLHSAVRDNNITEIEKLIQSGVYVDSTDLSHMSVSNIVYL